MTTINTNHHYLCTTMTLCKHRVVSTKSPATVAKVQLLAILQSIKVIWLRDTSKAGMGGQNKTQYHPKCKMSSKGISGVDAPFNVLKCTALVAVVSS